jgi:rubrerythrin
MATMVGTESSVADLMRHLIELDFDAIAAYDAAIQRLQDEESKASMRLFREDHHRHTVELNQLLFDMTGKRVEQGDVKQILTKGKVVLGALLGDRAILQAMRSNEDDTNTAYERAVNHTGLLAQTRELLHRNLSDERRHRAWIEQRLRQLDASTGARGDAMAAKSRN